jgi:hypothetical protein
MSSTIDDKAYYQSLEDRGHLQRELDEAKKEIARLQRREQEVRAEERERCAKIAEGIIAEVDSIPEPTAHGYGKRTAGLQIAANIRRGKQSQRVAGVQIEPAAVGGILNDVIARFEREYRDLTDGQFGTVEEFPEVKRARVAIRRDDTTQEGEQLK